MYNANKPNVSDGKVGQNLNQVSQVVSGSSFTIYLRKVTGFHDEFKPG